jgi:hypothetical protein
MSKVFIGGSRHVSSLSADVRSRLDRIMDRQYSVILGDANGADKAVQAYLQSKGYRDVVVFCAGGPCRNNCGFWPVRSIATNEKTGTFGFYSSKDRVMAEEATVGLMIWDGKSKGTLMNVLRLLSGGKTATVYLSLLNKFIALKCVADWESFVVAYASDQREQIERLAALEGLAVKELQAALF